MCDWRQTRDGHAGGSSSERSYSIDAMGGIYTVTGTRDVNVVIRKIRTRDSHNFVRISVGRIEVHMPNSISSTACTSGGEIEMVMMVTVVVLVAVLEMQVMVGLHHYWY